LTEHNWTKSKVARLTQAYTDGIPARQIAAELGTSKNSVVGKAYRLNLKHRDRPRVNRKAAAEYKRSAVELVINNARSCQFPHGDPLKPDFHFCGADTQEGSSYCADHHAICYRTEDRSDNKPKPTYQTGLRRLYS